jgi:tRNA A37 methylthiotransferase MiaB
VLVEGPSKRDPDATTGRTRQNKLVHLRTDKPLRPGSFATVRITAAAAHYLTGELVETTMPARHRTRIPVAATAG